MSPAAVTVHSVPTKEAGVVHWRVCRCDDGGRGPHTPLGPVWPDAKAAYRHMDRVMTRYPSPLRDESSPDADKGFPFPDSASAEAAPQRP